MTAPTEKAAQIPAEDILDGFRPAPAIDTTTFVTSERMRFLVARATMPYSTADDVERSIREAIEDTVRVIKQHLTDREARPSLPDSREERNEFNRGYLIAVANVMNMHKDAVVASELLMQLGVTIDDAEALGLTDYDMDALKRLRGEPRTAPFFKRKRRARARQGGNNG